MCYYNWQEEGRDFFLFAAASIPVLGPTQPPIELVSGALSSGVKLTSRLRLVPRFRMRGAIHPLFRYVLMAWCLVKQRENFAVLNHGKQSLRIILKSSVNVCLQSYTASYGHGFD
jgi:hypothetical protein